MTTLDSDYCYADSHIYYCYAESRYVDCRYAECPGAARLSYNTVKYVTIVKSFISLAPKILNSVLMMAMPPRQERN
jgi:hypothetical protein